LSVPKSDKADLISVVEGVNMKAYTQAIRHQVYVLFDALLATHRKGKSQSWRLLL
jgi:hypothetical protein